MTHIYEVMLNDKFLSNGGSRSIVHVHRTKTCLLTILWGLIWTMTCENLEVLREVLSETWSKKYQNSSFDLFDLMRSRSQVKYNTAIGFLDPQNIILDTNFITLGRLVTKLCSRLAFHVMAAAVAPFMSIGHKWCQRLFCEAWPGLLYEKIWGFFMKYWVRYDPKSAKIVALTSLTSWGQGQRSNLILPSDSLTLKTYP